MNFFLKMKRNGFSLVELMLVVAGLAGVVVIGMQLAKNQAKTSAKGSFDSDVLLTNNEITAILSDPSKCATTLGGKNALSTVNGINSVNVNKYYSVAGGSAPAGGYGNSNLQIQNYALLATNAEVGANNSSLMINYQNKNILKGSAGPATVTKRINLYVEVDASNNITKCRSLSSSSSDIWTRGSGSTIYYNAGNVGIGTTTPASQLDVAGDIRPGSTGVITGGACINEGSFAYDLTAHAPVFCNNDSPTKHWTAMGGGGGLGIGQTWIDVTASRSNGGTYTNSTGKPIFILVSTVNANTVSGIWTYVDGVQNSVGGALWSRRSVVSLIIPNGSTYGAGWNGTNTLHSWFELR